MSIEELLESYLSENGDVKSLNTERLLRIVVGHFKTFRGGEADATDLIDRNLVGFMRWRRQGGTAEVTLEHEAAKLRALAAFAHELGLIPHVRFKVKHGRPATPTAMTAEQVRAMFDAARSNQFAIGGVPGSVYFVALFHLAWDTGARANSIYELKREDIDLENRTVTFRVLKGNAAAVTKEIRQSAADALRVLLEVSPFPRPFAVVKPASIYHHLKRIKIAAGIPLSRRNGLHDFRRAYATHLWAAGGDATEALGHSSDAVTRKWYIDPRAKKKQAVDLLFDPAVPKRANWFAWLRTAIGL